MLLFVWESEGVKITSLNQEDYNYRNKVFYYVGVACITIMYSVVMTVLGCGGVKIPSKAVSDSIEIHYIMLEPCMSYKNMTLLTFHCIR